MKPSYLLTLLRGSLLVGCAGWLAFGAIVPAGAAVRALVVGIDDYPGNNRLPSCVKDAQAVSRLLTKQFGVPADNVRVLLNAEATADGIRNAFKEHLLSQIKPGDDAVFYFSGHGALAPNWGSYNRRVMKVLVSYTPPSARPSMKDLFSQAELKELLGQLQTTHITVVLDCCHAGSMTRALSTPAPENTIKAMDIGFGPAEKYLAEEPQDTPQIFSKSISTNIPVLWLGACLSNQVSYCGRNLSRFTNALIEQLEKNPRQPVADIFPAIQSTVEQQTRTTPNGIQTPIIEGPAERPLVKAASGAVLPPTTTTAPATNPPPPIATVATTNAPPPVATQAATNVPAPVASAPTTTPPTDQQFPLLVQTDRAQYTDGDTMKLRVTTGADCYLRLYLMNAATEIQQLFPNQYATNNFIRKGQIVEIPAPDTFVLRMGKPFGTETLLAVGSLEQFTDLFRPSFSQGGFQNLHNITPSQTATRGISIESARRVPNKISYAPVQYSVSPR